MKKFSELNVFNSTIIRFEEMELRTIHDPYLDNDVYKTVAVDQHDNQYEIVWEINHPNFDELEDESEACDWDKPISVVSL